MSLITFSAAQPWATGSPPLNIWLPYLRGTTPLSSMPLTAFLIPLIEDTKLSTLNFMSQPVGSCLDWRCTYEPEREHTDAKVTEGEHSFWKCFLSPMMVNTRFCDKYILSSLSMLRDHRLLMVLQVPKLYYQRVYAFMSSNQGEFFLWRCGYSAT